MPPAEERDGWWARRDPRSGARARAARHLPLLQARRALSRSAGAGAVGGAARRAGARRPRRAPGRPRRADGRLPQLARGIYSPVPIARGLDAGRPIESMLDEFRYEMIHVDADQRWVWMGRPVAPRIKSFFLEHLGWEPAIGRWFFEYQVNPEWWDKSYLDAEVTPLLAMTVSEEDGALVATSTAARGTPRPRHPAPRPARAAVLRERALRRGAVRRRAAFLDPAPRQRSL